MSKKINKLKRRKPSLWIRFNAWLRKGIVVWIKDMDGKVYQTIAQWDAWGNLTCFVYCDTEVGHCILEDGGKVKNRENSYIKEWKMANT